MRHNVDSIKLVSRLKVPVMYFPACNLHIILQSTALVSGYVGLCSALALIQIGYYCKGSLINIQHHSTNMTLSN